MSLKFLMISLSLLLTFAQAQRKYTTPVPILKQLNRHNEDGSYSYGYESADGSFKIETKYPNGEVYGRYGYVDDTGKLREVEYGASKRGFEPQGNDINVPPPTLTNAKSNTPLGPNEEDDGQYREDPLVYIGKKANSRNNIRPSQFSFQNPASNQPKYTVPSSRQYSPAPNHAPYYPSSTPAPYYPQPAPQRFQKSQYYNPEPAPYYNNNNLDGPLRHHPALSSLDLSSGSYSVSYTGR